MLTAELSALVVTSGVLLAATIAVRLGKRQRDESDDDNEDEHHNNYSELVKKVSEGTKLSCRWDASSHRLVLSFSKDQVPLTKKEVLDALNAAGLKAFALDDTSVVEGTITSVISIAPPNTTQTESDYMAKLNECFASGKASSKKDAAKAEAETENGDTATTKPASKRARGSNN